MSRFDGAVVLVSGGARGMGEAHVRAFVAEGARVVIEVTAAALFLASEDASVMTGAELAVDGGAVLGPVAPVG